MKKFCTLLHAIIVMTISVMTPFNLWAQDGYITLEAMWGADENNLTISGTLADALTAAAGDDVNYIRLASDITTTECFYIETGEFTLDLYGHNITASDGPVFYTFGETNITFTDTADKEGTISSSSDHIIYVSGEVVFNGGIYRNETDYYALHIYNDGNVIIKEGTFTSTKGAYAIYNSGTLRIEGGEIYGNNCGIYTYSGSSTTIIGGDFSKNPERSIDYYGGFLDLSGYNDITKISIYNKVTDLVPGETTILLPSGYCFYNIDNSATSVLNDDEIYTIGKVPETYYTISFSANGGIGNMEDATAYSNYKLPECTFTAPEDKMFKAWMVDETEYQPNDVITVTGNTTVTAVWTDYKPFLTIKMKDSYGDGWGDASITIKKNGEEIGTATIESGNSNTVSFDFDETAKYTFYWNKGGYDGIFDNECSFEILVDKDVLFTATQDGCEAFEDGVLVYTIEAGSIITAIEDCKIDNSDTATVIYDLQGRRVSRMDKGFYILNGKKVLRH